MKLKTFIFGLLASFGLPWLVVVAMPYITMMQIEPVPYDEDLDGKTGVYQAKTSGQVINGAKLYGQNGCYVCHTQVVRPTYAGSDVWRSDLGKRESTVFDYLDGTSFAQIGLTRNGPDLSNFGTRVQAYAEKAGTTPEAWIFTHFLAPASVGGRGSYCPPLGFLFEESSGYGQTRETPLTNSDGDVVLPKQEARILASYLMSLRRDSAVPVALDRSPEPIKAK